MERPETRVPPGSRCGGDEGMRLFPGGTVCHCIQYRDLEQDAIEF